MICIWTLQFALGAAHHVQEEARIQHIHQYWLGARCKIIKFPLH